MPRRASRPSNRRLLLRLRRLLPLQYLSTTAPMRPTHHQLQCAQCIISGAARPGAARRRRHDGPAPLGHTAVWQALPRDAAGRRPRPVLAPRTPRRQGSRTPATSCSCRSWWRVSRRSSLHDLVRIWQEVMRELAQMQTSPRTPARLKCWAKSAQAPDGLVVPMVATPIRRPPNNSEPRTPATSSARLEPVSPANTRRSSWTSSSGPLGSGRPRLSLCPSSRGPTGRPSTHRQATFSSPSRSRFVPILQTDETGDLKLRRGEDGAAPTTTLRWRRWTPRRITTSATSPTSPSTSWRPTATWWCSATICSTHIVNGRFGSRRTCGTFLPTEGRRRAHPSGISTGRPTPCSYC